MPPLTAQAPARLMPSGLRPANSLIRKGKVLERTGLSHAALYEAISNGTFPNQVKISARSSAWVEQEVDAWIAERIASRPQRQKLKLVNAV